MTEPFTIATVGLDTGASIGLCRLPGRLGDLANDVAAIRTWRPALVVSMTEIQEMETLGAQGLSQHLKAAGIAWRHFPIIDFGVPTKPAEATWLELSRELQQALASGQNILLHCRGGLGRSGMIALRLMIERGEEPEAALARLRLARPGAVETAAQMAWARGPVI